MKCDGWELLQLHGISGSCQEARGFACSRHGEPIEKKENSKFIVSFDADGVRNH